jgi:hypothetical protein
MKIFFVCRDIEFYFIVIFIWITLYLAYYCIFRTSNKAACHSDSFEDDVPDSATSSGYSSSDIASAHDSAEHVGTSTSPIGDIARQYYLSVLTEERQKLKGLERLGDIALVHKKLEDLLRYIKKVSELLHNGGGGKNSTKVISRKKFFTHVKNFFWK